MMNPYNVCDGNEAPDLYSTEFAQLVWARVTHRWVD